jgi:hypothetical protein
MEGLEAQEEFVITNPPLIAGNILIGERYVEP